MRATWRDEWDAFFDGREGHQTIIIFDEYGINTAKELIGEGEEFSLFAGSKSIFDVGFLFGDDALFVLLDILNLEGFIVYYLLVFLHCFYFVWDFNQVHVVLHFYSVYLFLLWLSPYASYYGCFLLNSFFFCFLLFHRS